MVNKTDAALTPGLTVCADCRSADAEVTVDPGERWARHVCLECADADLERANLSREMFELLTRARENPVYRPLPAPRVDLATADHSKLNALRAQWRAFERTLTDASRCWAILRDGSRCVRAEEVDGTCWTHHMQGCSVPGLGWRGGVPQGPILARRGRSAA